MPYITQDRREDLSTTKYSPQTAGELNYSITMLVKAYLNLKGKNYATLNEIVGVLECAKLELYRRIAAPYEDEKIVQNGDVY